MPVKDEADPDYRQREEKLNLTPDEQKKYNEILKKYGWDKEEKQK